MTSLTHLKILALTAPRFTIPLSAEEVTMAFKPVNREKADYLQGVQHLNLNPLTGSQNKDLSFSGVPVAARINNF